MSEYDDLLEESKTTLVTQEEIDLEFIDTMVYSKISKILTHLESVYWLSSRYPPVGQIFSRFSEIFDNEAELRLLLISPEMRLKLSERGLPKYEPDSELAKLPHEYEEEEEFDPLFIAVSNKILDPGDSRSFAAKLKEFEMLGVKSSTWNAWMKVPKYEAYVTKILDERFDKAGDQMVKMSLLRNISSGDLQSIKYYNEMTNKFRPQDQNAQTLTMMVGLLMEILARHVPLDVIDVVSEELESLPIGELSVLNQSRPS